MKVRSWRILLTTIVACGIMLAYAVHGMRKEELSGYAWCVLGIVWLLKGLSIAFSREKCEEQERMEACEKQIYRKFFGKFAPVMRWGAMILLAVSAICVYCLPEHLWVAVAVFAAALLYQIGMGYVVDAEAGRSGKRK